MEEELEGASARALAVGSVQEWGRGSVFLVLDLELAVQA